MTGQDPSSEHLAPMQATWSRAEIEAVAASESTRLLLLPAAQLEGEFYAGAGLLGRQSYLGLLTGVLLGWTLLMYYVFEHGCRTLDDL